MRLPGFHRPPCVLAPLLALIATACSSGATRTDATQPGDTTTSPTGTTSPPPATSQYLLPDTPNPASAIVTVESENAATASIPVDGGTVTATASDGTVSTLTIPPNALADPVTVTMTPIRSVAGIDFFSGTWIGVRLEPEGLHFFQPALLHMSPPGGERVDAFGFSSHGDGTEFHGQPLVPDATVLEMPLYHFSDSGARFCGGDCGSLQAAMPATPTEWEARLQNVLENLIREERERQIFGRPSDATLTSLIAPVFKEYWKRVIEPMLPRILTDCDFSHDNLWRPLAFIQQIDLYGLAPAFAAEEDQIRRTSLAAIENCFAQTAQPCVDHNDPEQMAKLREYMRMYEVQAGKPPFDADDPGLACGRIWNATSKVVFSPGGDLANDFVSMTSSFILEIDDAASTPNIQVFRPKSGSVTWQMRQVDNVCTTTGGPLTFTLLPQDGTLTLFLNATSASFEADGTMVREGNVATFYTHCTDARGDSTSAGPVGGTWLSVPSNTPAFPDGRGTMTGSIDSISFLSEWSFTR